MQNHNLTTKYIIILFIFFNQIFAQKPPDTLPVELVYFNGNIEGNNIQLFWGTATEINNFGYNVERSVDSLNWEVIGFVFGHGTSFSPKDYSFTDTTLVESNSYSYRLMQIDNDGKFEYTYVITISIVITSIEDDKLIIPFEFSLEQNYPNPFNPTTVIRYTIPGSVIPLSSTVENRNLKDFPSHVSRNTNTFISLKIYNILGKEISTLVNESKSPGIYEAVFNAGNLSSGIYFYKLTYGNKSITKKMNLIK